MSAEQSSELYQSSVEETLIKHLRLSGQFIEPPIIKLALASQSPDEDIQVGARDVAITTAVQCYAPGVAQMKKRDGERMQQIADNTLSAGHHTTRMHTHYTWQITGASRNVTHDIMHSHPFYNSEQQSQRYVEAKRGNYLVPAQLTPEQQKIYLESGDFANDSYFQLLDLLGPVVSGRMHQMYPRDGWDSKSTKERLDNKTKKVSQEIARYVLPIAQKTTYYHTLNEIQLLRMFRATEMRQCNDESRFIIASMVNAVAEFDPSILLELENHSLPDESSARDKYINSDTSEFDELLGGRMTVLVDYPVNLRDTIPFSVRSVLSASRDTLPNEAAWALVVDPEHNAYLSDTYDIGMLDAVTQTLRNANFVWATRISHTADSQRQRHRRTPGSTPVLSQIYTGITDYITPMVIVETPGLNEIYGQIMNKIYGHVRKALESGIPEEYALALLPNAQTVRVVESGDLFDWQHRLKQRLCYLAQEEIFFLSVAQAEKLAEKIPETQNLLLAPCGLRKKSGTRPRCPEGDRWCGQPVFHWTIEQYKKNRFI